MANPHTSPSSPQRSRHEDIPNPGARRHTGGLTQHNDEAPLPHEMDESRHSQERASERQVEVGKKAYDDTVGPSEDTDKGPVLDDVYNRTLATDRGAKDPRK